MKLQKLIFPIFLLLVLVGCVAEGPIKAYDEKTTTDTANLAIVYLPPEIELVEVDGKAFDTPLIQTGFNEVHLVSGHHELAIKYMKFWGDPTSGNVVTSKPVIFSLDFAASSKHTLKFDKPADHFAAQGMAQKFSPWLEDDNGNKVNIVAGKFGTKTLTNGTGKAMANAPQAGDKPLEHLKFWWKNASFKEKKAFEGWMNQN